MNVSIKVIIIIMIIIILFIWLFLSIIINNNDFSFIICIINIIWIIIIYNNNNINNGSLCLMVSLTRLCAVCWQVLTPEDSDRPEELPEASDSSSSSELNTEEVVKLMGIFEPSFSFLLLQLIKLATASKRKLMWDIHTTAIYFSTIFHITSTDLVSLLSNKWHFNVSLCVT